MKNCHDIRGELSAYLDGELTQPRRAEVDAHVASCERCQHELSEIRKLTAGVAALPRLQPAPRFLAEVRRKIARGENPEAMTWQDYAFRPFWMKVPLEVAALIVVIGLVLRGEHPLPTQPLAQSELARKSEDDNDRPEAVSPEAPAVTAEEPKPSVANQAPPVETAPAPEEPRKELVLAPETPGPATMSEEAKLADKPAVGEMAAGGAEDQQVVPSRGVPMARGGDALSRPAPIPSPSPVGSLMRSVELAQSKPGETVTLHARDFDSVRGRAQQLATRCSGKVVVVPQSKGDTEQILFVELPREYVAAFKLELLKTTVPAAVPAKEGIVEQPNATNAIALTSTAGMGAVLTGIVATNNSIGGQGSFGLRDDNTASPTVLLEIRVVAPTN